MSDWAARGGPDGLAGGVWQIDTETSTYIYDVDGGVVTRLRGGAGSIDGSVLARHRLRRDDEQIPVRLAATPVVGRCWDLTLDIRRDGTPTFRRTTIVCHIVRLV